MNALADRMKLLAPDAAVLAVQRKKAAFLDRCWADRVRELGPILLAEPAGSDLLRLPAEGHPRRRRSPEIPAWAAASPAFRPLRGKLFREGRSDDFAGLLDRALALLRSTGLVEGQGERVRISPLGLHLLGRAPLPPEPAAGAPRPCIQPNFELLFPLEWPLKRFAEAARFADVVRVDRVVTVRPGRDLIDLARRLKKAGYVARLEGGAGPRASAGAGEEAD